VLAPAYPYNNGEEERGRQKATLEHLGTAGVQLASPDAAGGKPWDLGFQVNERNLLWSDELKLRLIKVRRRCATP
jgi:hypothetical protein